MGLLSPPLPSSHTCPFPLGSLLASFPCSPLFMKSKCLMMGCFRNCQDQEGPRRTLQILLQAVGTTAHQWDGNRGCRPPAPSMSVQNGLGLVFGSILWRTKIGVRQIMMIILLSPIWKYIYPASNNILLLFFPEGSECLIFTNETLTNSEKGLYHP